METTYQIFTKSKRVSQNDWLALENKIRPFISSFLLIITIKNQTLLFYLTTPKDVSTSLSDHPNFFFRKIQNQFKKHLKVLFKLHFNLPSDNFFNLTTKYQIKKSFQLKTLKITYHKHPVPFYISTFTFESNRTVKQSITYFSFKNPYHLVDLNFELNHTFTLKSLPKFTNTTKIKPLLTSSPQNAIASVDLFPHDLDSYYLPVGNLDLTKHSLVVGQTGTGKSKLTQLIITSLLRDQSLPLHIVLIDPHITLAQEVNENFPDESNLTNFITNSVPLFPTAAPPQTATELTSLLLKTLLKDQFNPYLQRLLRYVLFTLYITKTISLNNLAKFLTDDQFRTKIINLLPDQYNHLKHFFDTDFIKYQTTHYEVTFMPVISLVEEFNFLPIPQETTKSTLCQLINAKPLTLFSLDRLELGQTNTKLISGLLIQQIFLLAQSHKLNYPTLVIIDEASLVENAAFATILSQSRKFNLSLMLSYQYLNQTQPDLLNSLKTNIYNYFIFKTSDTDAKILNSLIQLELNSKTTNPLHQDNLKIKLITSLDPRNFIGRLFHQGKFYPAFKAKTLSIN